MHPHSWIRGAAKVLEDARVAAVAPERDALAARAGAAVTCCRPARGTPCRRKGGVCYLLIVLELQSQELILGWCCRVCHDAAWPLGPLALEVLPWVAAQLIVFAPCLSLRLPACWWGVRW
eukprot:scaffold34_cov271-Prasinococcus_capsulatus_cf.AAC.5